jgi:hypothetical protein
VQPPGDLGVTVPLATSLSRRIIGWSAIGAWKMATRDA